MFKNIKSHNSTQITHLSEKHMLITAWEVDNQRIRITKFDKQKLKSDYTIDLKPEVKNMIKNYDESSRIHNESH